MHSKPVDYRVPPKTVTASRFMRPAEAEPSPKPAITNIPHSVQSTIPRSVKPPVEEVKAKIDPIVLKRTQGKRPEPPPPPPSVSAGPVDRVIELAFNPSREMIPGVTIIDRLQGRLLPQLSLVAMQWQYAIEVATYRQDSNKYVELYHKPVPVPYNLIEEYMYSVALWQKSIGGKNLERATDIALAETERQGDDDGGEGAGGDAWKE